MTILVAAMLSLFAPLGATNEMAMESPDSGSGGYSSGSTSAQWTYFSAPDPDGDGFIELDPIPYVYDQGLIVASTASVTDAEIEREIIARGLNRDALRSAVESTLSGVSEWDGVRAQAVRLIENGSYKEAVNILQQTAVILMWCGPDNNPSMYSWSIIIPLVTDCGGHTQGKIVLRMNMGAGDIALNEGWDDPTSSKPREISRFDGDFEVWRACNAATAFVACAPIPSGTSMTPVLIGAGFKNHHAGLLVNPLQSWSMKLVLQSLETQAQQARIEWGQSEGSGFTTFTNTTRFYWSYGVKLSRDISFNLTTKLPAASLAAAVEMKAWDVPNPNSLSDLYGSLNWSATVRPPIEGPAWPQLEYTEGYADLRNGHHAQWSGKPLTKGFTFGYRREASNASGEKHTFTFANPASAPYTDAELKLTTYRWRNPAFVSQLKTFPAQAALRLDYGTDWNGSASADLLPLGTNSPKFQRAIMTGKTIELGFNAVAQSIRRLQVVAGPDDVYSGERTRFILHGANYHDSDGASCVKGKMGPSVGHASRGKWVSGPSTSSPATYGWRELTDGQCKSVAYAFTRTEGTLEPTIMGPRTYLWSVRWQSGGPDQEVAWDVCRLRHPDDNSCA